MTANDVFNLLTIWVEGMKSSTTTAHVMRALEDVALDHLGGGKAAQRVSDTRVSAGGEPARLILLCDIGRALGKLTSEQYQLVMLYHATREAHQMVEKGCHMREAAGYARQLKRIRQRAAFKVAVAILTDELQGVQRRGEA